MAVPAQKIIQTERLHRTTEHDSIDALQQHISQELIIGLCGASGSGVSTLKEKLIAQLTAGSYHVEHIRISSLMANTKPHDIASELISLKGYEHDVQLQDLGDALRKEHGPMIAAQMAIRNISSLRNKLLELHQAEGANGKTTSKVAYIIDQFKHPSEIQLLREVYRNNFYLLGVLRTLKERKSNLRRDGISKDDIDKLVERDRRSPIKYGQQVEETLQCSDYFIKNLSDIRIENAAQRFVNLIHGAKNLTPTRDETGLFNASTAALRSACLSRQVGAAIMDDNNNILATGCNDVPTAGGGLYSCENVDNDKRCFADGGCQNDQHKNLVRKEIDIVLQKFDFTRTQFTAISEEIMKTTKLKSLIEYSRAIHAEMDAITTMARIAQVSTVGKTLYCTTYPCHNCARHIIAAGIKRVVYIEPYEKSLAEDLHGDSISHGEPAGDDISKVVFDNFEGTAPRRYTKFFGYNRPRKDHLGKPITYEIRTSHHVDSQQLYSYTDFELKIVKDVTTKIGKEITLPPA